MLRIPGAGVVDRAIEMLEKAGQLILVGSKPPVAFFGYPNKPSLLYKEGTLYIHWLKQKKIFILPY